MPGRQLVSALFADKAARGAIRSANSSPLAVSAIGFGDLVSGFTSDL